MSSNAATAYNQGVSEADAAIAAAANLGLTDAAKTGTIIYYDLEIYNTADAACHNAVKSFISGWSSRLRAKGNQAGLYGFAGTAPFSDFAGITNSPDGIWLALWGTSCPIPQRCFGLDTELRFQQFVGKSPASPAICRRAHETWGECNIILTAM